MIKTRALAPLVAAVALMAWLSACGSDSTGASAPGCALDSDCANEGRGFICSDSQCLQLPCTTRADCPGLGYTCINGTVCGVTECTTSQDCVVQGLGTICLENACAPGISCASNNDCPGGWECNTLLGQCITGSTSNAPQDECSRNSDCPSGQQCDRDTLTCINVGGQDAGVDTSPADTNVVDTRPPEDTRVEDTFVEPDTEMKDIFDEPDVAPDTVVMEDTTPEDTAPEDTAPEDTTPDVPEDTTPQDTAPEDTAPQDTTPDVPEDTTPEDTTPQDTAPEDTAPQDTSVEDEEDTGPPPTPPRGVYHYERLPVGGFGRAVSIDFHPDSSYAVILESYDIVHIHDWDTGVTTRVDLGPPRGNLYWSEVVFDPSGEFALLVGTRYVDDASTGVILRFDDALWRGWDGESEETSPFSEFEDAQRAEIYTAIEYPHQGGLPILLTGVESGNRVTLREFDPVVGSFTDFVTATISNANISRGLAFANNEFGEPGIIVGGGDSGAEVVYYTEIGGIGEWRRGSQLDSNTGNISRIASHPSGDYALLVNSSGSAAIYRYEAGQVNDYGDAPRWSNRGAFAIRFQEDGRRALVVGGNRGGFGSAFEFRHDEYDCGLDCGWTEVSIPDFSAPPYNATSGTLLTDVGWRPGCDGGLIVGGWSNFNGSVGYLIKFQIENGVSCD